MEVWLWAGFVAYVLAMLAVDLYVINRPGRPISTGKALAWTAAVASQAMAFSFVVYYLYENQIAGMGTHPGQQADGTEAALQFFIGWIIEQSLSLDNVFVIAVIFNYFQVPREYQHRTLFLGVLGAIVFRAAMILAGAELIHRFEWMEYVFGAILILTAVKLLRQTEDKFDPARNLLVRAARRLYPVSPGYEGERFFTRINGRRAITPLLLVLLVIESTDVMFAIDSIPAIFAITKDPFIVFTSNIFAILNLRSLYFALVAALYRFRYLKHALVLVLLFVGIKMLLPPTYREMIPTIASLAIVLSILLGGVAASLLATRREATAPPPAPEPTPQPAENSAGKT